MKKSEGMVPPTLVRADDGQKGDFGPSPSSFMEAGTTCGFRMRSGGAPKRSVAASTVSRAKPALQRGSRIARPTPALLRDNSG